MISLKEGTFSAAARVLDKGRPAISSSISTFFLCAGGYSQGRRHHSTNRDAVEEIDQNWMSEVRCDQLSLVVLFHQMTVLFRSGISLVDILIMKAGETDDPELRRVVEELLKRLESGHSLADAMSRFPRVFSTVTQTMVRIGTETGGLSLVLERLSLWYQRDYDLKKRFWAALSYPLLILVVSFFMSVVIYGTVLPGLLETLDGLGVKLHWSTRIVRFVTGIATDPIWWGVFGLALFSAYRALLALREKPKFVLLFYSQIVEIPLLGPVVRCFHTSRFAHAASILLDSGTDILKTVKLAAQSSGSPMLIADIQSLTRSLTAGSLLSEHLLNHPHIYDPLLTKMVVAGEESSQLGHLLKRAGRIYENEMEYRLQVLSAGLEPLLLAFISIQVGFVMLSVYISVYSCLTQIQNF